MDRGLGERIRQARLERGWSIRQLGDRTGLSRSRLSRWERGFSSPGVAEAERLGKVLNFAVKPVRWNEELTVSIPFGSLLRAVRNRNGYSLETAAAKVGVSKAALSRYESGARLPSEAQRPDLMIALGASEGEIQAALAPYRLADPDFLELHLQTIVESGERNLDLSFLALDAYWAVHGENGRSQRLNNMGLYAQWLGWWYRDREANHWATTFLAEAEDHTTTFGYARLVRARLAHLVEVERRDRDAQDWLEGVLRAAGENPDSGFLWREYAALRDRKGHVEAAKSALIRARELGSSWESPETFHLCCDLIEGSLLAREGQPARALDRAFRTLPAGGFLRFATAGVRAKLLVEVGDRSIAAKELGLLAEEALSLDYVHFANGLIRRRQNIVS